MWSTADTLTEDQTRHWTGTVQSLYSAVRVDGKVFRVMGREVAESQADFTALVEPVYRFLYEFSSRVPMTDWYWTHDGKQRGFQARSVVGGVFIKMLAHFDYLEEMVDRRRNGRQEAVTRSRLYLRGIAAKVRSMLSSTASVERTPPRCIARPSPAFDFRASPHVPDRVARCTDPGELKKNAVWTGAVLHGEFRKGRKLRVGAFEIHQVGVDRENRRRLRCFACRPFFRPENSATSSAVSAVPVVDGECPDALRHPLGGIGARVGDRIRVVVVPVEEDDAA